MDDYQHFRGLRKRFELLRPALDERLTRLWAAAEALTSPARGIHEVSQITGLSRSTLRSGIEELKEPAKILRLTQAGGQRRPGGGRRSKLEENPELEAEILLLMEGGTSKGNSPLEWTCRSLRQISDELAGKGYSVSYRTVGNLLNRLGFGFGRPGNYRKLPLKARREAFAALAQCASTFFERDEPVLSVRSAGRISLPLSHPVVGGLLNWWFQAGLKRYPKAVAMLLIAESRESMESLYGAVQALAAGTGRAVSLAHYPPGSWRWSYGVTSVSTSTILIEDATAPAEFRATLELVLTRKGV